MHLGGIRPQQPRGLLARGEKCVSSPRLGTPKKPGKSPPVSPWSTRVLELLKSNKMNDKRINPLLGFFERGASVQEQLACEGGLQQRLQFGISGITLFWKISLDCLFPKMITICNFIHAHMLSFFLSLSPTERRETRSLPVARCVSAVVSRQMTWKVLLRIMWSRTGIHL